MAADETLLDETQPDEAQPSQPPAAAAARRTRVRQVARPFFFTPSGEKVEVPRELLGAFTGEVDPGALDPDAAPVPDDGAGDDPGQDVAIHTREDYRVVLSPRAQIRVSRSESAAEGEPTGAASVDAPAPPDVPAAAPDPAPAARAPEPEPAPRASIPAPPAAPALPSVDAPLRAGEGDDGELGRADAANVEIRSEEIDEILSEMPGGLLRWGIGAVFVTLCVLLSISWFISYPDVVKGRITLTSDTPPVRLVARQAGEVMRVFAEDGARVAAGAPLVLLRSSAELEDVQALAGSLARAEAALQDGGDVPEPGPGRPLVLGPLQQPYAVLQQAYADFRLAGDDAFFAGRLEAARAQVADLERLAVQLTSQQALMEGQLAIAERARERARELLERGLGARADVDRAEEEYLQRQLALENGRTNLTSNQVQLAAQRAALLDLAQRRSEGAERGRVALRNALYAMRAAITEWEQQHLLRAPVAGTVAHFRELRESQFAAAAEPLVAVLPEGDGQVGRLMLSGMGAGKVRTGQRVIIRLDGYPHREFGTVDGRVEQISQLGFQPDARSPEVTYLVEVALPQGLVTSYGRTLAFRQEMAGEVDVVTEEMRLLERIFSQLRSLARA